MTARGGTALVCPLIAPALGGNRLIHRAYAQASMSLLAYREYKSNSGPSVCNGYYCNTVPRILLKSLSLPPNTFTQSW